MYQWRRVDCWHRVFISCLSKQKRQTSKLIDSILLNKRFICTNFPPYNGTETFWRSLFWSIDGRGQGDSPSPRVPEVAYTWIEDKIQLEDLSILDKSWPERLGNMVLSHLWVPCMLSLTLTVSMWSGREIGAIVRFCHVNEAVPSPIGPWGR